MPPIYPGSKDRHPHFAAISHVFALSPETRNTLPANGIRWNTIPDFEPPKSTEWGEVQHMTWPIFVDDSDHPIYGVLETEKDYQTYLYPFTQDSLADWMTVGAGFFFVEGTRRVGRGTITEVLV